MLFVAYSDLPNNCAANLIIFWDKTHLHNLIRTYTFINFEVIFYLHVYSDLHDYSILRKFPTCTFIFIVYDSDVGCKTNTIFIYYF